MDSGNSPANSSLRKTALNALHKRLGAKMVNFGGWDMPVEYPCSGGLMCEHRAVRGGVGVFDVSHMGDIRIHGAKTPGGALATVQLPGAPTPPPPTPALDGDVVSSM